MPYFREFTFHSKLFRKFFKLIKSEEKMRGADLPEGVFIAALYIK